jgi:3-methyladenine DNA glycosylase AlkD
MSSRLARDISQFLDANPDYRAWKRLPAEFLRRSARLTPDAALEVALELWNQRRHRSRMAAYPLLCSHPAAFKCVRWRVLEEMGNQMDSWGTVDAFALLAGTAWREGQISDARVKRWTSSQNRWWRRAALVCTVLLNRRSVGGYGDTARTIAICGLLVSDRDDMVVKGLSWALRELIATDRVAVERFVRRHEDVLAARVKREVRNKLTTGLKNPSQKNQNRHR